MDGNDIVARLRSNLVSQQYQREAALVIEQLRQEILTLREGSDDLVARLRDLERDLLREEDLNQCYYIPAMVEAADEIERLRAELRTYTGDKHNTEGTCTSNTPS